MTEDHFIPPIKSRTDDELLQIAGAPQKWTLAAVNLALAELNNRKIPLVKIETARYLETKKARLELLKKSNESYQICDFILSPGLTFIEFLFAWELHKDGYHRKARQQKRFRILILFCVSFVLIVIWLGSFFKD